MGDRTARDHLVRELKALRARAGSPSYTSIAALGDRRTPKVKLGRSKLSQWFNGECVPANVNAFEALVDILEHRSAQKQGTPRRPTSVMEGLRAAAEAERRCAAASTRMAATGGASPPTGQNAQPGALGPAGTQRSRPDQPDADELVVSLVEAVEELMTQAELVFQRNGHAFHAFGEAVHPSDLDALAAVDRALVAVRTAVHRTRVLMPTYKPVIDKLLELCTDVRSSCTEDGIPDDDDGFFVSFYLQYVPQLKELLEKFVLLAAQGR
ncbi:hypothetical protein [Streptomyces griseus]|uniref:hypothetical protein n=1 Tax=Streptomyces griseus TaxID=1911 RepID=UPI003702F3EA